MLRCDHAMKADYVDQKILRTMIEMYGGGPARTWDSIGQYDTLAEERARSVEDMCMSPFT